VPYRVLEGGRMVTQLAQRLLLNTDKCNWSVQICSASPPLLVGSQCLPQWSALAEGWPADVMVNWSLTHLVMSVLM
jgi:hypothetical protein